jgi:hypothetical protein
MTLRIPHIIRYCSFGDGFLGRIARRIIHCVITHTQQLFFSTFDMAFSCQARTVICHAFYDFTEKSMFTQYTPRVIIRMFSVHIARAWVAIWAINLQRYVGLIWGMNIREG